VVKPVVRIAWWRESFERSLRERSFGVLSWIDTSILMLNTMEFSLEFYESKSGRCPVMELLNELKASDAADFAAVMAGLARLRSRECHRLPLSKALGDGLFELRHVGKLNTRLLWFFTRDRRIVLVHGIRNKGQAISTRDLETAFERRRKWQKTNIR
jgi:hypothetical protein